MADDEAIALYGMVKKMAQAMAAREAALDAKTAALAAAVAELRQLPGTLSQQTGQYIEAGIRASIRGDFKGPIEDALRVPIGELQYATTQARDAMREVRSQSKMQSWTAVAIMVLMGIILGVFSCYYFFVRDLNQVNDRLDIIQQQIALPAQAPEAKPAAVPSTKAHHGSHAPAPPSAP